MNRFRRHPTPPAFATASVVLIASLLVTSCSQPTFTRGPDPDVVLGQAADWPAQPAPDAAVIAMRDRCSDGVAPVVATDDRGIGVVFVLMGTPQNLGTCEMQRQADGSLVTLGGGASLSFDPIPDDAFRIFMNGAGPAWTPERASAQPQIEWRALIGIAPVGTARVRAAVGNHAVEATLGGRLFVLAWPVDIVATLLVALDAGDAEIARLDAASLATPADPHSLR